MTMESVNMETALKLLSLPKNLGKHPTLNEDIIATLGRFGPYIKCGTETRSIPGEVSLLDLSAEKAIEILSQPKKMGRGRAASSPPLKDLGKHPQTGTQILIKSGRYGPYVTDGTINASLSRGADPASVTMEEALSLLQARADKIAADGGVVKKKKRTAAPKAGGKKKAKKAASSDEGTEAADA
jgi:DNA topoisomerase-1